LIPLNQELGLLSNYHALLRLRFEDAILLDNRIHEAGARSCSIPPVSLQMLLENAVKHNEFTSVQPLVFELWREGDHLIARNRKQLRRTSTRHNCGMGLRNLDERCRLVLGRGVTIQDSDGSFEVRVPVRQADQSEVFA